MKLQQKAEFVCIKDHWKDSPPTKECIKIVKLSDVLLAVQELKKIIDVIVPATLQPLGKQTQKTIAVRQLSKYANIVIKKEIDSVFGVKK